MADGLNNGMVNSVDRVWSGERTLPELIEAAEAVERMMATPGWDAVQRVIGEQVAAIDSSLDHGPAKEAADYAKQHGRRSALRSADEAARAIVGRAAKRRREAEERVAAEATNGAGESASERTAV